MALCRERNRHVSKRHHHESDEVVAGQIVENSQRASDEVRIPVREEELVAGTQVEEQGRVHVHKDVVTEQQTLNVPVQREQVSVERVPVDRAAETVDASGAFQEGDIEVPVMGEEVMTSKRAHVVEEVRLHKDTVTEQEQVGGTVRREQVWVEDAPDTTPRRAKQ